MVMEPLAPLSRKYKAVVFGGVVALGLLAGFAVGGSRGWWHLQRLRQKQERMEVLAFRLEQENARLRDHLRRVETDNGYLEQLVRERLGWIKPGEMVYRVSGVTARPPGGPTQESARPRAKTEGSVSGGGRLPVTPGDD